MNTRNYIQPLLILLEGILLLGVLAGCGSRKQTHTDNATTLRDLPQLKDSGRLVALTLYSSTSYFIYRGQEMGFQYELVQQFAESLAPQPYLVVFPFKKSEAQGKELMLAIKGWMKHFQERFKIAYPEKHSPTLFHFCRGHPVPPDFMQKFRFPNLNYV